MDETMLTTMELVRLVHHLQQQIVALAGESHRVILTKPEVPTAVPLNFFHSSSEYSVQIEIMSLQNGTLERVDILEKQRNGLFIQYYGSAKMVELILWIQDRPAPSSVISSQE